MLKLLICGGTGRLGSLIAQHAHSFLLLKALSSKDNPQDYITDADVVIDVSLPENTPSILQLCQDHQKPLVIGTTGHNLSPQNPNIPLLIAPNFSIGMNALYKITQKASQLLGHTFDVNIIDKHHHHKKDTPSGSAKQLLKHSQRGSISSIRSGSIIGEHQVLFHGPSETIEITHRVQDRSVFALGALQAAQWLSQKPPGLYSMEDTFNPQPNLV